MKLFSKGQAASTIPKTAKEVDMPYVSGKQIWDERLGSVTQFNNALKIALYVSLGLNALLGIDIGVQTTKSTVAVFAVPVNKIGQPGQAVLVPQKQSQSDLAAEMQSLSSYWVTNLWSVSNDPGAQSRYMAYVASHTADAAESFVSGWYKQHPPYTRGQNQTVDVKVDLVSSISPQTYQVQFTEYTRDLSGRMTAPPTNYVATLTIGQTPPKTTERVLENPLGLYVIRASVTNPVGGP